MLCGLYQKYNESEVAPQGSSAHMDKRYKIPFKGKERGPMLYLLDVWER